MKELTVLVPLDTTEFSESSLLALPMLKTLGFTRARLVTAFDSKQKRKNGRGDSPAALEAYLQKQAERVRAVGLEAETEVLTGEAANAVLAATAKPDVDLVLVATHGRTGIARWRLGSVGDKLIKDSPCPRLVIGPNIEIDLETYSLKRILVPLDGSDLAELSLPIARYLARLSGAEVDLLRSVSVTPVGTDPMMASVDLLTPAIEEAKNYLQRVSSTFEGNAVNVFVLTGNPGDGILEHMKKHPVDLVIMASRGRRGMGRLTMGSVAERALHGPDPVLVFEPEEARSRLFEAARA